MAQSEDTELRDLVMEALEKNGSLAKIRALLRANVFLAFEDDYENIKQNVTLDNVLKIPEGLLALSLVHEFLEFCNLKNTLFVYKSETRQEKEYKYESKKRLTEKLNLLAEGTREPALVSLIKHVKIKQNHCSNNNKVHNTKNDNCPNYKDDQNCTYIVHDDSSCTTSQSQSDNSSDEKNKLHLGLQLDNSDTDTSSDSMRDKSSSEYIPNEHILQAREEKVEDKTDTVIEKNSKNDVLHGIKETTAPYFVNEIKIIHGSSSDSTSYVELKTFHPSEVNSLSNVSKLQIDNILKHNSNTQNLENELSKEATINSMTSTLNHISSPLHKKHDNCVSKNENKLENSAKSEIETAEYSYDFTMSGTSKDKEDNVTHIPSPHSIQEELSHEDNKVYSHCPHENSQSSQSSVSISDVADLISEKSLSLGPNQENELSNNKSKTSSQQLNQSPRSVKSLSNDSGEFSDSPVPSLSNLSFDIHSD